MPVEPCSACERLDRQRAVAQAAAQRDPGQYQDPADDDALWITEVWDSAASHQASLALPAVKDAIARGRPLIAGFDSRAETRPLGGHGLASA